MRSSQIAHFLRYKKEFKNDEDTLRAYNWGNGNMRTYLKKGRGYYGQLMPPETQQYVAKVFGRIKNKGKAENVDVKDIEKISGLQKDNQIDINTEKIIVLI